MNTPTPVPVTGTNVSPTIGSLLGSLAGLFLASKMGLNPMDAGAGSSVVGGMTMGITALFHWLGMKTGIPGLG
jgi:hypothetical protein